MTPSGPDGVAPPYSSGLKVIIVGLGLGGLAAAIECHRKGHTVIAFDQMPELKPIGDSIGIPSNAGLVISKWGNGAVHETLSALVNHPDTMDIHDINGRLIVKSELLGYGKGHGYPAHRGELAKTFYEHAKSLGIDFRLGKRVTQYWERENEAGIVVDGEEVGGDCVIGSDGVHSKARGPITGQEPFPNPSGYAMFRAWFDGEEVRADPNSRWIFEGTDKFDQCKVFIAEDLHVMVGTGKMGKECFWLCTHKDARGVGESWSAPARIEDMLEYIKDWPCKSLIEPIVRKTPKDRVIDFQLLWRDPLDRWVSPGGRMILIGDAAHPFLPTSGQGGGQAIEDAAVVAITLELAGKGNVPLALRAAEKIRYRRATIMQRSGIETRDAWHKTDWDAVATNASLVAFPRPQWIYGHDCQRYTYEQFESVAEAIKTGKEYVPTNIPKEGEYHRAHDFDG